MVYLVEIFRSGNIIDVPYGNIIGFPSGNTIDVPSGNIIGLAGRNTSLPCGNINGLSVGINWFTW